MLGGDSARGADVAVGALLRLWEHRRDYQPHGKLEGWLIRTANRLCLDQLAQTKPSLTLDLDKASSVPLTSVLIEQNLLAQSVRDAVMELPESHRAVLVLSVYEGMSYREVADALEISVGTVASRKNHAISLLRRSLSAWQDQRSEDR
jgi:RNA polymerase sigma-70 factor (ECF subfamily)